MEKYLKPELEVIEFDLTDVISTSGGCESDGSCGSDGGGCPLFTPCDTEGSHICEWVRP